MARRDYKVKGGPLDGSVCSICMKNGRATGKPFFHLEDPKHNPTERINVILITRDDEIDFFSKGVKFIRGGNIHVYRMEVQPDEDWQGSIYGLCPKLKYAGIEVKHDNI